MTRKRDRTLPGAQGKNDGPVCISPEKPVSLRPPRRHSPDLTLVDGRVEKSYENCGWWLRQTVGRMAIGRECWALRKLAHSRHTPKLISRPKPWIMVSEYVKGTPLEELSVEAVDKAYLAEEAASLLRDLTEAGVAHGDLGHDHWQSMGRESNLLWTDDKRLMAIDFGSAVPRKSSIPIIRQICQALGLHDELLTAKIHHHFPSPQATPFEHTRWPVEMWELLRFLGKL